MREKNRFVKKWLRKCEINAPIVKGKGKNTLKRYRQIACYLADELMDKQKLLNNIVLTEKGKKILNKRKLHLSFRK